MLERTIFRTKVKDTVGKVVHLFKQRSDSTTTFDPDVQNGIHACDLYRRGSPFVCSKPSTEITLNDLVTHKKEKTTCPSCLQG